MAGNSFFTSTTVQLNRLLRGPYPQDNGLSFSDLPLGEQRRTASRSIHPPLQQRVRPQRGILGQPDSQPGVLNEFDREPTLWQPNANGRPHRITANGLAEIPFGTGRKS